MAGEKIGDDGVEIGNGGVEIGGGGAVVVHLGLRSTRSGRRKNHQEKGAC